MEHPLKKTQSGEFHQTVMQAKQRIIPGRCNPSEEVSNINNLDKLHFTKLKTLWLE